MPTEEIRPVEEAKGVEEAKRVEEASGAEDARGADRPGAAESTRGRPVIPAECAEELMAEAARLGRGVPNRVAGDSSAGWRRSEGN